MSDPERDVPALIWKRTAVREMFVAPCDHGAGHDALWIAHQTEACFPRGHFSVSCEHEVFCLLGIDVLRFIANRLGEHLTPQQERLLLDLYGRAS